MKKIINIVVLPLGIIIFILLAGSLGFLWKFQAETRKMAPLPTRQVSEKITVVNNSFVDLYLIKISNGYLAIDAGTDMKQTVRELKKIHVEPSKVQAVFLTHTDSDHVAALQLFKNAKVYLAREEEQMINGKTHRQLIFNNSLSCAYQLLRNGQIIDILGSKVKCILTPGHTPGSMSYLVDGQYLFTGDTLSLKNGRVALFNQFFNMNSAEQQKSIHMLAGLPKPHYLLTAHYGYTTNLKRAFGGW